mmetsp:Transcript_2408/g.3578  ORF Transcript_2408/g.3578 Transcript_2408/m.3578 type:complete len:209 (+) Transcript_2408:126-752(+)|eukprot:CAMPEP_0195530492 /NCGR_PEP_ID=MMETSP0794_2-20130614/33393_1 /TAXON_ID=515487 /ORGANISM="Stephanopyxis turris, Strain CCMP 815" /LENGTH=208 /DNA_ID=CAMNT_0040662017 /DNA_START=105 /DNA_END=731 /DNA_ORIENTATION=+
MIGYQKVLSWSLTCLFFIVTSTVSGVPVTTLTDSNFELETQAISISNEKTWLILFKADNCPHCQAAMPEFNKLSEDEELDEANILLGTVNVPTNRKVSSRFLIRGFPTVILVRKGKYYKYTGKRKYAPMKKFVMKEFWIDEGVIIPPTPTALKEAYLLSKAVGLELWDAATGKNGMVGVIMVVMIGIFVFLFVGLLLFCFYPVKQKVR